MNNKLSNNQNYNRQITENKNHKNSYGIFDPFFNEFFKFPTLKNEVKDFDKIMNTDIYEDENNYILEIDMPGFDRENINIEFNNGYLTVTANKNETVQENHNYIRREKYVGSYARSFYIGEIKEENIEAKLEKGILNIKIQKEENNQSKKKIEIK